MNINELINFRKNCFFCQEELDIFPSIGNANCTYSISNNFFVINCDYFNFSIDIQNGSLTIPNSYKSVVNMLSKNTSLKMKANCSYCKNVDKQYYYQANIILDNDNSKIVHLLECVDIDFIIFTQKIFQDYSVLSFLQEKESFHIPIIDLNKVSAVDLENKLKTYYILL